MRRRRQRTTTISRMLAACSRRRWTPSGVGYTYDFGCFGTTISPIFRRLWRVLSVLAPGSRAARKDGEKTVEKGPKTG